MPCHHEISQPHNTPKVSQKKKNSMFHFPSCSKRLKKNKKKTSRCETTRKFPHPKKAPPLTTPPHRTRVPQRSVAFRPFRKKKKTWIWQRRPRPPELRQSTSATNLDPRGNKKHQKVGFEEQHFWMKLDFFNVERKKAGVFGMTFFFGWFFVVEDDLWKLLVWEIWILLDDFSLKRLDF